LNETPDGRTSLLRGNVGWLALISFLNDLASEMIYPLLPLFLATLGAGAATLGLVEGAAESASSLLKLVGGRISDRARRRKPLVVGGYALAALVRPLISLAGTPGQVLAVRLTDRVGKGLRTAPRDALLAGSGPPQRRSEAFGLHRAGDHAGAVAGPLLASAVLLALPGRLRLVFALTLVPGLIATAVAVTRLREADAPAAAAADADQARVDRRFWPFLALVVLFTLGNASDAFLLLHARNLGVPVAAIPLLWSLLHVSKTGWSVVGGRLGDRWGPRSAILSGWVVYAAVYAGFAVAGAAWQVWVLFPVYGLFYGLTEAPEKAYVAALAGPAARGRAFGAYHAAVGVAALPASLAFGLIWTRAGAPVAFLVSAGLALSAALLLPLVVPARSGFVAG
jgi:MFS family permease